jgi:hypothetical protein
LQPENTRIDNASTPWVFETPVRSLPVVIRR